MNIELIHERVHAGNYLVKNHAVYHALKEDFELKHMIEAILNGRIIEEYPDDQRVLICGSITSQEKRLLYLHIVCECSDPVYIEIVTAYIPNGSQWENPPFRRRK
ncbi:MAG: hypothetical protein QG657_3067 [Acidobacteriota bacterium]|nr:hypothetical protein [Acidobacteriota bacterium]